MVFTDIFAANRTARRLGTLSQISSHALPLRYALLKDDFYFLFS